MSKILISVIACLLYYGCTSNSNGSKYFYVLFTKWDDYKGDTICFFQAVTVKDEVYHLEYWSNESVSSDTLIYELSLNKSFKPTLKISHEQKEIALYKDTTVIIDRNSINIMNYNVDYNITDGATNHYWTPDYGVFLIHSTTWPSLKILCSTDSVQNQKLMKLIKAICPNQKFFFRGRLLDIMNI